MLCEDSVQYSVQYIVQYNTVQCTIQYSTVYSTLYSTVQYNVQYSELRLLSVALSDCFLQQAESAYSAVRIVEQIHYIMFYCRTDILHPVLQYSNLK